MRGWKLFGGLVVAFLVGLSACERGASDSAPADEKAEKGGEAQAAAQAPAVERVPLLGAKIRGSDRALVTIVEISDYACPFCRKAHETVEALVKEYEGNVRLAVFENPLPFHRTAKPAAKWAYAAGEQGKYWEARDLLFANQKHLDDAGLADLTGKLGLDPERAERDMASRAAEQHVQAGLDLARSLGVEGTPTFFINGVRIIGAQPAAKLRAAIDEALGRAHAMVARGVRPEKVYSEILKTAAPPSAPKAAAGKAEEADGRGCGLGCGEAAHAGAGEPADTEIHDVDLAGAPIRGAATAPVTIVVFTDFECPFCQKVEDTVRALEKEYGQKVRVAYRSYPLPFHEHSREAAKAALAAHRQGKFFEYRDALFAHQEALDRPALIQYAKDLSLDEARFQADLDDPSIERAVAADEAQVERLGVKGTPCFFINGRKLVGAQPIAAFRAQIDAALAAK